MNYPIDSTASRSVSAPARPQIPSGARRTRMLTLTSSSIGTMLACPRRYQWAYEFAIRRSESGKRASLGTAYHAGLEVLGNRGTIEEAVAAARANVIDELDLEIAACMVAGWQWRWSAAPLNIVASEQVFEFKPSPRSSFVMRGKIDAIAQLDDGRLAVVEYKTVSEDIASTADYWRRLAIDRQIGIYMLGAQSLGYDVSTVMYDAARVPGLKPKLLSRKSEERESLDQYGARLMESFAEKPDWYFARHEIPRLESDVANTRTELTDFADMIRAHRSRGRWPRNTDACRRWGTCPWFGPCADSWNVETQGIPNGFERVADAHVELTVNREPTGESQ